MIERDVYLDNNATTPVDGRVLAAMLPLLTGKFGNAGSRHHRPGREAHGAVEKARGQVANLINARAQDVLFTSGATEANNLAVKGAARMRRGKGRHIITQATEHKSVLASCDRLAREGFRVTVLPVDRDGRVAAGQVAEAMTAQTILVSIMAANNEVGTLQPLGEIGALCRARGVLFHADAAQAAGKIPLDVEGMGIDLMSLSAHKMYGPQGVGALYVRRARGRAPIEPLLDGGGQEGGLRPGTLPAALIAAMGRACTLCEELMEEESSRLARLRDRLHRGLSSAAGGVELNGHQHLRLPGTLNLRFDSVEAEALVTALHDVAASPGAACSSASPAPSHVLIAMGLGDSMARASVRFSLGRFTSEADIERAIVRIAEELQELRGRQRKRCDAPPTLDPQYLVGDGGFEPAGLLRTMPA